MSDKTTILVNKRPIKAFTFNGGESQISIAGIEIGRYTGVYAFLKSADDIMRLLLTVDAIRRVSPNTYISLHIPYFPYARQDRVCTTGEAFSVEVMARLINGMLCEVVHIEDPHSDVTTGLIWNVEVMSQADLIITIPAIKGLIGEENLLLLAPDKGAASKTRAIAEALKYHEGITVDVLHATKARDATNGKITETIIPDGVAGRNILIPDDICDGGATFIELAKKLKEAGAGDLYLYVTHGIFSRGLEPLKDGFKHIYCRNLFIENTDPEFLTTLEDRI